MSSAACQTASMSSHRVCCGEVLMAKRMPERRSLLAVIAVVTTGVLPAFMTGALSVQVRRDLHFGEAALGLAVGAFFLTAAMTSALFGGVAERLGPNRSMQLSGTLSAATLVMVAAVARSLTSLVAVLAVGGFANALSQPAANLFIARAVDATRLGIAFAVKQAAVPAATLLGGLAVPAFALTVGWRWAYVAGAGLAVAGVLSVPRVHVAPAPSDGTRRREGDTPLLALAVLAAGVGLGAMAAGTLGTFLVNASVEAGIGEGPAGVLVATGSALVIVVRLVAGGRADRRQGGNLRVVVGMLALGAAGYAGFALQTPVAILVAAPVAFGAGWGWPGLFNLAVVRANPNAPGLASGITQTGTYVGAVVGPLAFGSLVEGAGYGTAWLLAAAASLLAAGAMAWGRHLVRRERLRAEDLTVGL
jgi:MFS family permease